MSTDSRYNAVNGVIHTAIIGDRSLSRRPKSPGSFLGSFSLVYSHAAQCITTPLRDLPWGILSV